jgi:hypothetical protein
MPTGRAKDNIRLRGEPSYTALEIGFIRMTEMMEVLGVSGDFLKVRHEDQEGFVIRKFVLISEEELASLGPSAVAPGSANAPAKPTDTDTEAEPKPKPRPKKPTVKSSQK